MNGVLDFVLVLASTGDVVGTCGLFYTEGSSSSSSCADESESESDPDPEISFLLHPAHWGRGLMQEALTALLPVFRARNINQIIADVDPRNGASLRVLREVGFVEYARRERMVRTHLGWCGSVFLVLVLEGVSFKGRDYVGRVEGSERDRRVGITWASTSWAIQRSTAQGNVVGGL